ncbi:DUF1217 domain-containing protein [Jiella sp. MQZ9-1]|uniref:DUF1217 domain-containing protein n=1 Tax=Jiella flava TaxID=2816857 RepID=A0A939JQW2_9HYPH|nr:DUF1217 domain-containing protein [Jiella flava]MBO0661293.1 DUF1217 domain-containing protein [Jiella flava]MCD2469938.1 DUF1217 domain-containing protein [Jiella flava]
MLSTFSTYQLYTRDQTRVLDRLAADPVNKRLADYYRENIGKVKSVDDFMKDYRLYSYAMTAYGLEDQIDSRALIRKVLESDLSDKESFANKLSDERYRDFAKAFSFTDTTKTTTPTAQSNAQLQVMVDGYSEHRVKAAQAISADANYFTAKIEGVKTVDQFLADDTLFKVALEAAGIDSSVASKSFIREVLTTNKADQLSAQGDDRYTILASMLPFDSDGQAPAGGVQSASEANSTAYLYYQQKGLQASPQAAALQVSYYESKIGGVTSADDLIENSRLLDTALRSVGLNPNIESPAYVWNILTSDRSDPNSVLNKMPETTAAEQTRKEQYTALAKMFQFNTDGSLDAGVSAQTSDQIKDLTDGYLNHYADTTTSDDRVKASFYAANVKSIQSVTQFMSNATVYDYALKSVGLDPATENKSTIMQVLRSDPSDPKGYAARLGDDRYLRLAAAFNFGSDGKVADVRRVQSETAQGATIDQYLTNLSADDKKAVTTAVQDSQSFNSAMRSISTVDKLLADSTAFKYVMKAIGFDSSNQDTSIIQRVLTSDPNDPKSFVNALGVEAYTTLRAAFDVDAYGNLSLKQDSNGNPTIVNDYLKRQFRQQKTSDLFNAASGILQYNTGIPKVATMNDLLNQPNVLNFALKAYNLDGAKLSTSDIKAILTSDLSDPNSAAAKYKDDRYLKFAAAFNFDTDGTIKRDSARVQSVSDMLSTQDLYLRQKMEEEAGDENNGVRLALYFKRAAPKVTSAYEFLSDTAMLQVVKTALGLPDQFSSSNIDVQARTLEKKIDITKLGDSDYMERFINRFLAMYDVENSSSTASSNPALSILDGSASYL